MPEIKLVKVISCNFQDPKYPATNLLRGNFGTWLCPLPRKNMSMEAVFMMERACVIDQINIGNCGSAFVTVSVSHYGSSEFETLLPSSVLMDRQQTRSGSGKTSVQLFQRDKFCENVRDKKWGIIKITCTQPFDAYEPFGLSFCHIVAFEKDNLFVDTSGKENKIMAKRNIYNKTNTSRPQSDLIHKIAAASPRSIELMKACMNLHNSDKRDKISEVVDCTKEMPLRENVSRTEKISDGTDSRRSKCPICCGSYAITEIEVHAAQCTGVSNNASVTEENDEVMCPVCKCKFSSEYITSHADACAEKRLDSVTKSTISSPQAGRHKPQKFINIYEEQDQKTPPNSEEKDCDIKFKRRVKDFLESQNALTNYMKHITIGEVRRLYEQDTKESLQSHEIKKFAAIVRSYFRSHTYSEGTSSSNSKNSENQDVVARHPVCRRNLLSLEDSSDAQKRNESADDDFISRNIIIHASPTTPTKRSDTLHTPKRKKLKSGPFTRKRLANGVHTLDDATYDGSSDCEPSTVHTISEDVSHMVQCHLCEEFFSIGDIGNHSSTCIVPADIHLMNSEREICPICDELIARDSIEQHAALCAENKFG